MAKVKRKQVEESITLKDMPIFTGIGKYKPLPNFGRCKNC